MANVPVHIITGFLGSGKTTFLKNLLDYSSANQKMAIIQNEFAPGNFDGQELKKHSNRHFEMLEVNNGSVFCVCLLSSFINSFSKFVEQHQPDTVFFETSGLSDPIAVAEMFNAAELQEKVYLASLISIVDATAFLKIEKLQLQMRHQVQVADHILLNKVDLITNTDELINKIRSINQIAPITETSYCTISPEKFFNNNKPEIPKSGFHIVPESSGRPDINTVVFKTSRALNEDDLVPFLQALINHAIRVKGSVKLKNAITKQVQYSGGKWDIYDMDNSVFQTELIAMGFTITPSKMKEMYKQYCS